MLSLFVTGAEQIFLACGATDFRKQANSLAAIVNMQFQLDPFSDQCVFIFCNQRRNTAIQGKGTRVFWCFELTEF